VNTALLWMTAVLTAPANGSPYQPVYRLTDGFESAGHHAATVTQPRKFRPVIRGQTPGYDEVPTPQQQPQSQPGQPKTFVGPQNAVPDGNLITPGAPLGGPGADPFLNNGAGAGPQRYGVHGPQPYRLHRWLSRYDIGFLPESDADRGLGEFEVFELDTSWQYSFPIWHNWIFSFTQEFNLRAWEGPQSNTRFPTTTLPGSAFRFGWDFQLATPANHAWSALVAFNPSLNSDFEDTLTSDAWNWDGRGMIFYRATPQWTFVGGAGFWDRVNDRVVPYAGVIWTPDDRWEWRILFPKGRVSYFLGQPWGVSTWIYARSEYHVEAYEVEIPRLRRNDKVEVEDWRILLGLRWDTGWVNAFWEAGWVFGRDVDFLRRTSGFSVNTGFITRAGIRF